MYRIFSIGRPRSLPKTRSRRPDVYLNPALNGEKMVYVRVRSVFRLLQTIPSFPNTKFRFPRVFFVAGTDAARALSSKEITDCTSMLYVSVR